MTDMQLRVRVAELLGWIYPVLDKGEMELWNKDMMCPPRALLYHQNARAIPAFEKDLNAMHEAAKNKFKFCTGCVNDQCGRGTWGMYTRTLEEVVENDRESGRNTEVFFAQEATARQRAEAFVITVEGVEIQ